MAPRFAEKVFFESRSRSLFGKLLTARRLSALCAFSCAWVHFSRRLDCAHLYSTTRLPARENTGEAPSTGAMLRKNSTCQGKEMAKSKSMNTLLTAIAVVECDGQKKGNLIIDHPLGHHSHQNQQPRFPILPAQQRQDDERAEWKNQNWRHPLITALNQIKARSDKEQATLSLSPELMRGRAYSEISSRLSGLRYLASPAPAAVLRGPCISTITTEWTARESTQTAIAKIGRCLVSMLRRPP